MSIDAFWSDALDLRFWGFTRAYTLLIRPSRAGSIKVRSEIVFNATNLLNRKRSNTPSATSSADACGRNLRVKF